MNSTSIGIGLQKFCHPSRPDIGTPWSDGAFTYASDSAICVRVPRCEDIIRNDGPPTAPELFAIHENGQLPIEVLPDIADFVRLVHVSCKDCDGSGQSLCFYCGHHMACEMCDGMGVVDMPITSIEIAPNRWIGAPYYALLHSLPGLRIDLTGAPHDTQITGRAPVYIHYFKFDGGDGLLAGCWPSADPDLNIPLAPRATKEQ